MDDLSSYFPLLPGSLNKGEISIINNLGSDPPIFAFLSFIYAGFRVSLCLQRIIVHLVGQLCIYPLYGVILFHSSAFLNPSLF